MKASQKSSPPQSPTCIFNSRKAFSQTIGQRVSDSVIEGILQPIGAGSEAQIIELSKNLLFLSKKPGVALKPLLLSKLEYCLSSTLTDVRLSALNALSDILWRLSENAEDKKAREEINKRFYLTIARVQEAENFESPSG